MIAYLGLRLQIDRCRKGEKKKTFIFFRRQNQLSRHNFYVTLADGFSNSIFICGLFTLMRRPVAKFHLVRLNYGGSSSQTDKYI